jgi:hypothetical protein
MNKYKRKTSADSNHWNKTAPYRERIRGGKGRARASVSDLKSVSALRGAFRNDLLILERANKVLEWAEFCIAKCVSVAHEEYAGNVTVIYGSDGRQAIALVRKQIEQITHERSPRTEAGAPRSVLAKARAARITSKKGGVK